MDKIKNVPVLRFSGFNNKWEIKMLGDSAISISSGKTKPQGIGEYFVYGSTGIIGKCVNYTHNGEYLLIARVGANAGKINRVMGKFSVTDNTLVFDVKSTYMIKFIYFSLVKFNLNRIVFGSGQPLITGGQLKSLKIGFPCISEQTKIAEFLSEVDKKIELLTKKKQGLESYKKGIMQKIFNQEIRFKDDNGNDYPDWEEKKFFKYIKLYRGSSPRPINMYVTNDENGVNWIKIGDTKKVKNFTIYNVSEKITREGSLKSRQVSKGELILANSMSFGKTYLLELNGCIYDGWFVLREYEELYNKLFLIQLLNSEFLQRQYKRLSTGGVVQNISSEIVYSTNLVRPTLPEQSKIADYLSDFDTKISQVSYQLDNIKLFKNGLLQKMFV